jgi:hypothetical protein
MGEDQYIDRDALIEGRIVHYDVLTGCRAAIVVRSFSTTPGGAKNLHVFLDGGNDRSLVDPRTHTVIDQEGWLTSVLGGTEPGQYHDPRTCHHVQPTSG